MNVATGKRFFERFAERAQGIYPELNWILYDPSEGWSAAPESMDIAVLVDDAYCRTFKEALLAAPALRWVHTENSGIDDPFYSLIIQRGIKLTTSPGANAPEVAEFIFGLILREFKRLDEFGRQQQEHLWRRLELESLSDKTILILGLGAIGSRVATIAKAFGMNVMAVRKTERLVTGVDELGTCADLEQFMARADVVVLALPLTPMTENLLGDKLFAAMRDHAILINIARGGIIDMAAMKRALTSRPALRVCLDVLPLEPLPPEDELWTLPNLFLTPHVAWSSPLYRPRAAKVWLNNLMRLRDGKPFLHLAAK